MAFIEARADVKAIEPEMWRRTKALMVYSGGTLGVGGGARSADAQRALFLSRYYIDDVHGTVHYNGHMWSKKDGVASAAPPGLSYHEDDATVNGALAIDFVGDLDVLRINGPDFGLTQFAAVNNEPWHGQPIELPHSRSKFVPSLMYPLTPWVFPGAPTPLPPPGDTMELAVMTFNNTTPHTTFLGYCNRKPQPGGGVANMFWDVLWIDGTDPEAMKMLNDQITFGGAQTFEFGHHVSRGLWLLNDKLPTSAKSDGTAWTKADWGRFGSG
jgi:hypothetical protein